MYLAPCARPDVAVEYWTMEAIDNRYRMETANLLTESEAAAHLSVLPGRLKWLRIAGDGPPHIRVSDRVIRYRLSDLDRWIESRASSLSHTTEVRASA
jgi:hypothetical protein